MSEVIDAERFPRLAARLQLKVPKENVAQIHEFATDLAVGYDEGAWPSDYILHGTIGIKNIWDIDEDDDNFREFINRKWGDDIPYFFSVATMGYLTFLEGNRYGLTEKALRLVDEPVTPPNVFISYKRSESSAFALLLEARIKYETNATPFLDKSLEPGMTGISGWRKRSNPVRRSFASSVPARWNRLMCATRSAGHKVMGRTA